MAHAPATKRAAISADIFNTTLTITFSDGRDMAIDITKLDPKIQHQAMLHGLKQKLVDAAAIARSLETGRSASLDDKYLAVREVFDRLTGPSPTWNKERAANVVGTGQNILVHALMKMTGKDKTYVDDFLASKTKEERLAMKSNPKVLAIIAELQAARGTGGVDTDALLGELGGPIDATPTPPEGDTTPEPSTPTVRATKDRRAKAPSKKALATV